MKTIIFAGGTGTRLWPLSRKKSPKQFEKIIGSSSTLQSCANRLQPDIQFGDIYVATNQQYVSIVNKQLPDLPPDHVFGEPQSRDVGPAVGLIAGIFNRESPDEPISILWSDHLVKNDKLFRKILKTAGEVIQKNPDKIIFISQKPRFASVNLGWIQYGRSAVVKDGIDFNSFIDFQYRPDKKTAEKYHKSGRHAWNLGYFVATPAFLWAQYKKFAPNLYDGLSRIVDAYRTGKYADVLEEIYPQLEKISFDNAILEKLNPSQAYVISEDIGWSDVGAWEALKEALENTEDKNVTQGRTMLNDTKDSLVYNYTDQLLVTIDMEEALVVNTDDVILVCKKTSVPKIKKLVESLNGTENEHLT